MAEIVPRRVERWAYLADSKGRSGYRGEGNPDNTDTATFMENFSGGRIEVANFGRASETTRSMLGKDAVAGKREDRMGKALSGNFEGIIIEVGVNDIASRGGGSQERWEKNFREMKNNIVEMHVRAWAKGAGAAEIRNAMEVLGRRIEKIKGEISQIEEKNRKPPGSAMERAIAQNRRSELIFLRGGLETMEMAMDSLKKVGKKEQGGRRLRKMVFVEIVPWKDGSKSWSAQKAERTIEYNRMLHGVAATLNNALGELKGPRAEVAEVYGLMASREDGNRLHNEYAGVAKGGRRDYLHPGAEGRKTMAAGIVLGHFPELARSVEQLGELAARNEGKQETGKKMIARK